MAFRCTSLHALKKGRCINNKIPMGIATPKTTRGNYYLMTNKKSPFGRYISKQTKLIIDKLRKKRCVCKIKSSEKMCKKIDVLFN